MLPALPSDCKYLTVILDDNSGTYPNPLFPKIISTPPLKPVLTTQENSFGNKS